MGSTVALKVPFWRHLSADVLNDFRKEVRLVAQLKQEVADARTQRDTMAKTIQQNEQLYAQATSELESKLLTERKGNEEQRKNNQTLKERLDSTEGQLGAISAQLQSENEQQKITNQELRQQIEKLAAIENEKAAMLNTIAKLQENFEKIQAQKEQTKDILEHSGDSGDLTEDELAALEQKATQLIEGLAALRAHLKSQRIAP